MIKAVLRCCQLQSLETRVSSNAMAAYNSMNRGQLRTALSIRGLIVTGDANQLRARLAADDAFGAIECFFGTMSDSDLEDMCRTRYISIRGHRPELRRQEMFEKLLHYNHRKGGGQTTGGWLNSGLPTPEDRLTAQSREPILGTPGSGIVFQTYINYIQAYRQAHGTIENALTFRYWRICQNPGVALHRLWPIRHADCRVL